MMEERMERLMSIGTLADQPKADGLKLGSTVFGVNRSLLFGPSLPLVLYDDVASGLKAPPETEFELDASRRRTKTELQDCLTWVRNNPLCRILWLNNSCFTPTDGQLLTVPVFQSRIEKVVLSFNNLGLQSMQAIADKLANNMHYAD